MKQKHFKLNENWLDIIDDEYKSYFLGLMLSDGFITTDYRIGLRLKEEDDYLVKQIFSQFSQNYGLNSRGICLHSKILHSRLTQLGITRNKTLKQLYIPEDIPHDLIHHFIRGYFDGDGSISVVKSRKYCQVYLCSVNENILKEIQNQLKLHNIDSKIYVEKREGKSFKIINVTHNNCKDMFTLKIERHKNLLRFYEYLYRDCKIKMLRKYKIYEKYYTNTVLTLESKGSKAVQRIGDETFIEFEKLKSFDFQSWKEVPNMEEIRKLYYEDKISMNKIGKLYKYDRTSLKDRLDKYMKEYNSPKSVQTLT